MYTIGQFLKICKGTVKSLRHYEKIGLLSTVGVDEDKILVHNFSRRVLFMGVLEEGYLSPITCLALEGISPECCKVWALARWAEKIILHEPLSAKLRSAVSETPAVTQDFHPVPDRSLQEAPQSLEDFLEKYLDQNLLDTIEPGILENLLELVRSLKSSLANTMRKNGVEIPPIPSMETIETEAIQSTINFYQGSVGKAAMALGIGKSTIYRKIKEY